MSEQTASNLAKHRHKMHFKIVSNIADLVAEPSYKSAVSRILELRRRKQYLVVSYVPDPVDKR